jgi:2-furoate---CoA ligase
MNLGLSLLYAAERHPDAEAVVDGDVRLTYAELLERVRRLAGGLAERGIGRGDRFAAVVKPRHESVLLYWAAQWLGATIVPLSHRVPPADVDYCVEDSEAKELFRVDLDVEPLLAALHPRVLDLEDGAESLMLYTSGTTGRQKGVPRSHRADRAAGLSQALQHGYRFADRTLGVMPLYHTMGIHSLLAMHHIGGCYVCQRDWDAGEALRLIERERISSLYLAPTLYHDLAQHPRRADFDLSSVETLAYAGAAMPGALVERCIEILRPRLFVNHYGSTEIYTFSVHRDQAAKPGCAGRPALNARLRLGENGEVLCQMSSDEAFGGYWNRPDADAKAIRDGWYHTGDVGRIDDDGDLWVVGRVDDMIITGGENVHPLEVEDVLARHPAVLDVAVIGAPDERLGQRVVACVVTEGDVAAADLDAWCLASETLARFKRPREYRLVDALPKSPAGKVLRRVLREQERVPAT